MGDFICEERHSSRRSTAIPEGFVAEMRPSSRRVPPPSLARPEDDQTFVKLVSNKSNQEYTDILTVSVIKLVQTLLTGQDIAAIEGSVQVSLHGQEIPLQIKLNESFPPPAKKDLHLSLEMGMGLKVLGERSPPIDLSCDGDHFQYNTAFSPDIVTRDDFSSVTSSPPRTEQMASDFTNDQKDVTSVMHSRNASPPSSENGTTTSLSSSSSDSGEESGHTTCSHPDDGIEERKITPSQQSYVYGPKVLPPFGADGGQVDHDGLECPLVILSREDSDGMTTDVDQTPEQKASNDEIMPSPKCISIGTSFTSSSSDDSENNMTVTCSEDTDSEVPMDLSGDCKIATAPGLVSMEQEKTMETSRSNHSQKCKLCSHISPDMNALSKHNLRMHQMYTCQHCSRVFTAKNNLKRHIRIHTGLRPYKCSQCSMTFARRDDLKGHQLRHDYNKPFRCSLCKKGYTDRACVKNHMVKEHGSRLLYVCPQCGESFDREDVFSAHKKTHPELTQYACDICPFIGSNNLMACKHSLVHTRKLLSCKPCNAYFADPFGYTDHIRKHKKNEKFVSYVCCFCDITLPTYEQFVRHEYSHAHCKTHACHLCNKQFRSKVLLQEHLQSHTISANTIVNEEKQTIEGDAPTTEDDDVVETTMVEKECERKAEDNKINEDKLTDTDMQMNFQEEVLDLTMKKPIVNTLVEDDRCINGAQSSSYGLEKMSTFDVPRNGCVSEFSCPRKEESASRCLVESTPRYEVKNWDEKSETYTGVVWRQLNQQRSTGTNDLPEAMDIQRHLNFDNLRSVVIEKPTQMFKAQRKYAPYPLNPRVAELASKFLIARGRSPFTNNSPMRDNNKGLHAIAPEIEELVIEKDNTGRPIHLVTRPVQANNAFMMEKRVDGKENTGLKSMPVLAKEFDHGLTPSSVVYGLTGKEYRKEDHLSPSFLAKDVQQNASLHYIKPEPVEPSNSSLESLLCEKIPEPVTSSNFKTSPTSDCAQVCDLCSQTFENFSQLESHSVLTHKRYMCEYCNKGFTSRPNRDRHVRYHTGERPYKCDLCNTAFHRGDDLKYHRTTRHPEATPFVCTRCSASFTWKRDLDRHIRHSKCKL